MFNIFKLFNDLKIINLSFNSKHCCNKLVVVKVEGGGVKEKWLLKKMSTLKLVFEKMKR